VTTDQSIISNSSRGGFNKGRRVCVVGGGIGGLTAALAFARSGAEVAVYEQAAKLTEVGAGIQITPNGARALEALGLEAALSESGLEAQAVEPTDALTGQRIARFDLGDLDGPPYRLFHRADLIDVLANACRAAGVQINLGEKTQAADLKGGIIVGADGIRSTTRNFLNDDRGWVGTNQVAWRAVVQSVEPDNVARIWMAPRRHVVTYPLPNGRVNIVAVCERKDQPAEGWHHEDEPNNLRSTFVDCDDQVRNLLEKVETTHLWGLNLHKVAQRWSDGRICLLGDAAHPTLPFLAQGANLAVEDAYVMAAVCDRDTDVAVGLQRYETLRRPRVTRAIEAANANARNYHLSGISRRVAHMGLKTFGVMAPKVFLNRMDWLYGHDVTKD